MSDGFGRIELVSIRSGWSDEARHFTPWLAANLDRLGEHLGLALELRGTEHAVGRYALDILCEDVTGRVVIVENQLEASDHTHLGKLLTYCAGTGAKVLVWVAPLFTDEHVAALEWLNTNTVEDVAFFAVEVQLLRIGDSPLAPQFNPVVRPNEFVKSSRTVGARSEWDWQSYADALRVPTERLATGRRLVERFLGLIEERQLPWQPKFQQGLRLDPAFGSLQRPACRPRVQQAGPSRRQDPEVARGTWAYRSLPATRWLVARQCCRMVLAHPVRPRRLVGPTGRARNRPDLSNARKHSARHRILTSMPTTFIDDDSGFIRWRDTHPSGCIVNHEREPKPLYLKLHRSTCPTLQGVLPGHGDNWTTAYAKTCSDDLGELQRWAATIGGPLDPCGTCEP